MRSDGISSGKTRSSAADISFQPTAKDHACQSPSGKTSAADMLQKVYLEVTTDCNLDCKMCMRHSWEDPVSSMSSETFGALISQLRQMPSVSTVNFSGFGEPTVHPQFFEFLLKVKEAGLRAELVTNGITLETDVLEKLLELELDKLVVSLDGAGPSVDEPFHHESIERVHTNLRNLYVMKLLRGLQRPEVGLEFVASQRNINQFTGGEAASLEAGVFQHPRDEPRALHPGTC